MCLVAPAAIVVVTVYPDPWVVTTLTSSADLLWMLTDLIMLGACNPHVPTVPPTA